MWHTEDVVYKGITYTFMAKISDEPSEFGIDEGKVFKLSIVRKGEDEEIVVYDRGWEVYPEDNDVEEVIDVVLGRVS